MMNDPFASDEARILSSKAFRLLGLKTQVLTSPQNPFTRTRLSHVMEVVAQSVVVSDMLGLNTGLVRSIAIGHDIGHVPFGHPGEYYLAKRMGKKEFCHEKLGPLVMQRIERDGRGLNLAFETMDGMMRHSGNMAQDGMTQEAWLVRYMDKVAYIFADFNDMRSRLGFPISRELELLMQEFGQNQRERVTGTMAALIIESAEHRKVSFEHSHTAKRFKMLRDLMMQVYVRVTEQRLEPVIEPILQFLEDCGIADPYLLFALMTDKDIEYLSNQKSKNFDHLKNTALKERLGLVMKLSSIDLTDPNLSW